VYIVAREFTKCAVVRKVRASGIMACSRIESTSSDELTVSCWTSVEFGFGEILLLKLYDDVVK